MARGEHRERRELFGDLLLDPWRRFTKHGEQCAQVVSSRWRDAGVDKQPLQCLLGGLLKVESRDLAR